MSAVRALRDSEEMRAARAATGALLHGPRRCRVLHFGRPPNLRQGTARGSQIFIEEGMNSTLKRNSAVQTQLV